MAEPTQDAAQLAVRARQDVAVKRRLGGDIFERSSFHRARLERAGLTKKDVKSLDDLARLPPMELDDVRTAADILLIPRPSKHRKYGALRWVVHDRISLAYSAADLRRLEKIGAETLERACVDNGDVILDLTDGAAAREQLQVRLGARRKQIPLITATAKGASHDASAVDASVVVGTSTAIVSLLKALGESDSGERSRHRLHTALVIGDSNVRTDKQLATAAERNELEVVRLWAPPGVMAAWSQCRGGAGLHTWPEQEVIEVTDALCGQPVPDGASGDVVWSGIGWYATAFVRLTTHAFGHLETGRCPHCGRVSPRFVPDVERLSFADALDADPDIDAWAAELHRTSKGDEVFIWVVPAEGSHSLSVLSCISDHLVDAHVEVVEQAHVERLLEASSGEKYGDRRAFSSEVPEPAPEGEE